MHDEETKASVALLLFHCYMNYYLVINLLFIQVSLICMEIEFMEIFLLYEIKFVYTQLTILSCRGSIQCLKMIGRDGDLSPLRHSYMFACQMKILKRFLALAASIQKQLPEVLCKKGVLRNFAKFIGKHLCQGLFFNKVAI